MLAKQRPVSSGSSILILTPDLSLDGGVTNYFNTLKLQSSVDVDYFYVNTALPETTAATIVRLVRSYLKFIGYLFKKRYDLIHVNPTLDRRSFYREVIFIFIARMFRRPTLVFFHGWVESFEAKVKSSPVKKFFFRISYAKASGFIVLSTLFQDKLAAMGVPADTPYFVETMVADSSYLHEFDLQEKISSYRHEVVLLFLGRILEAKGIFIALDSFNLFSRHNPDIPAKLVIAGDGVDLQRAKQYVDQKGIRKVCFLGNIEGQQKKKVLHDSHIMILPSYSEGLPCSILEGMLYGMPVIARATGGIPDVITHEVNGYLTDSLDPGIYANFLRDLCSDPQLYEKMALHNHTSALGRFTTDIVRARLLDVYEKIIGGNSVAETH